MRRDWILFLSITIFLINCKVSQSPRSAQQTTDTLEIDTSSTEPKEYLITQKGDTLDSLFQKVTIEIARLLPDTVTLVAVGDIMMGTQFPDPGYLPPGNGELLWQDSAPYLQAADITFGNLEGTVLDGTGEPKDCSNPKACYLFKMPVRLTSNLKEVGFDLLSLANNHANDFGETGRKSTLRTLDSLNIGAAGSVERPYTIEKIHHLKIGFVAFAPNKGTLGFYDRELAKSIVASLDTLADLVVLSIHGGAEGLQSMHVTRQTEFYYGENRGNIYSFSHEMIDAGADVIIGHGPHVPRAVEVYKSRFIAYSLGNFCTYGRFNLKGPSGEAPLLSLRLTNNGAFVEGNIVPFRQSYTYGPLYDQDFTVVRTIKKLSEEDFPESPIIIDHKGRITYIQN